MGLFDNATPYAKVREEEEKRMNAGGNLKFLHQGVFPMTFVGAEYTESKNGNRGVIMKYDTGFVTGNGEANILWKTYWLMDKNTLGPDPSKHLINPQFIINFRNMLFNLFQLEFEKVSSITEGHEFGKIAGMCRQIEKQLTARPVEERQITGTVEYPRNPNDKGKYYLELDFVNPIEKLEEIKARFKPKDNPNPPRESGATGTDAQAAAIESSRPFDNEDNDLPF